MRVVRDLILLTVIFQKQTVYLLSDLDLTFKPCKTKKLNIGVKSEREKTVSDKRS